MSTLGARATLFEEFMKKIGIVGTGYVGLVTGACIADFGNQVVCVDIDEAKVHSRREGKVPFFEPGLGEAVAASKILMIAVGTPSGLANSAAPSLGLASSTT